MYSPSVTQNSNNRTEPQSEAYVAPPRPPHFDLSLNVTGIRPLESQVIPEEESSAVEEEEEEEENAFAEYAAETPEEILHSQKVDDGGPGNFLRKFAVVDYEGSRQSVPVSRPGVSGGGRKRGGCRRRDKDKVGSAVRPDLPGYTDRVTENS